MSRYFTRTKAKVRAEWDDDVPMIPGIEVPEHEETYTGLVDQFGNEICRYPRPVGFGRDKEWA